LIHAIFPLLFRILILYRREDKAHVAQVGNGILENQGVIVFEVHLNGWAEAGALGKENQMLELEDALDHLGCAARLLDLHGVVVLGHDGLLLGKVALAAEDQV
jgi:hypothetical protein